MTKFKENLLYIIKRKSAFFQKKAKKTEEENDEASSPTRNYSPDKIMTEEFKEFNQSLLDKLDERRKQKFISEFSNDMKIISLIQIQDDAVDNDPFNL